MKWRSGLMKGAPLSLVLILASCKGNPDETKLTYMPDMADVPTAKPQRNYLDPPEGSVTMYSILYPESKEESEKLLQNPFTGHAKGNEYRVEGAYLYAQVCATCHGPDGKGESAITVDGKFPRPPDITNADYAKRGDGFFFHTITFGSVIMPYMGDKLDPAERWKVVLHLRTLQNQQGK